MWKSVVEKFDIKLQAANSHFKLLKIGVFEENGIKRWINCQP